MGREFEPLRHHQYAPLAQSVERRTVNPQVVGSSPTGGAKYAPLTQLDRVTDFESVSYKFETCMVYHGAMSNSSPFSKDDKEERLLTGRTDYQIWLRSSEEEHQSVTLEVEIS